MSIASSVCICRVQNLEVDRSRNKGDTSGFPQSVSTSFTFWTAGVLVMMFEAFGFSKGYLALQKTISATFGLSAFAGVSAISEPFYLRSLQSFQFVLTSVSFRPCLW
ncbi:uncharacterized protein B0H18DRAFT_1043816 [Fomitopsis serialis]|uniref:uncharacterized protein n=1 Tax=Fomitopsis serialis TaxID=139415 RepID=UPI002008B770|nr:uncharacterized protein B0H18DRAFT_1043816 [Neoantrodia serialis]KAH9914947.1 hypothetical protein B0H18DRAFT_1043816 [Neoantrodia serialis]